jgi:hypothetical protein
MVDPEVGKVQLSSSVTVRCYLEMERCKETKRLARFIEERLSERYITPLEAVCKEKKNGFLMMAASCLLIETLVSFHEGWVTTDCGLTRSNIRDPCKPLNSKRNTISCGEVAICYFFERESSFACFRGYGTEFYKNVRCGILHQGETRSGWKVRRSGPLFEPSKPRINATKFLAAVKAAVTAYARKLEAVPWEDDLWRNFRQKMDAVINNCKG